jgi:hypothetical protein
VLGHQVLKVLIERVEDETAFDLVGHMVDPW